MIEQILTVVVIVAFIALGILLHRKNTKKGSCGCGCCGDNQNNNNNKKTR